MALHRFAVKGLERDSLDRCCLERGGCLPNDRRWGLLRREEASEFDHTATRFVHKNKYFAACSAGLPLARLRAFFDDASETLRITEKKSGDVLLVASLREGRGRAAVEDFFGEFLGARGAPAEVLLVEARQRGHLGNTTAGMEAGGNGDLRTVHLVNLATVRALEAAAGVKLDPLVFRANVIFDGAEPWEEFRWVGGDVALGGARLRVVRRTIRCPATCVDLAEAAPGPDVPALLSKHFPEHGPYFGVYAQVLGGGEVALGDTVRRLHPWWRWWA